MPIIEEYDAIARRLRELRAAIPKGVGKIANLERWRVLARETAEEYIERRGRDPVGNSPILPRRF